MNRSASEKNLNEVLFSLRKNIRRLTPRFLLDMYFASYPFMGNLLYGRPSRKIKLIAVTGTDGKSSTVIFTARILREAGYKVGFFSSISYSEGINEYPNSFKMTMPGRFFLQRFLQTLVKEHCDFGILEVTSEGIKQKRHLCIDFDVVLITNIHPEHIESHGGFEQYKAAKATLFKEIMRGASKGIPKTIIVNGDDETKEFLLFTADRKVSYGSGIESDVQYIPILESLNESVFTLTCNDTSETIHIAAGGPFIIQNVVAALSITHALGVDFQIGKRVVEGLSNPPGRFEIVTHGENMVLIDYAHTIYAVEALLLFLRKEWKGRIIHVFGAAGGGRDKWKRKALAQLSERYTDVSILSEENSFDERTEDILNEIREGFTDLKRVRIIPNRTEAIREAITIQNNQSSSLVLLTGKGSETVSAGPHGKKLPYNEKNTVLCLFGN